MDGLYNRRRERVRLDYLKERGGLCRVIELMLLGAVLGFLGVSPGSGTTTFHSVMTSLVLASVTVVFLAHLLQPRQRCRCCTSPGSWTVVVLTLMAQVVLAIQGVENFQKTRGHTVSSRLATPVPITPVHSRQRPTSRLPDDPMATAPPVNHMTAPRQEATAQTLEMAVMPNVKTYARNHEDSGSPESNLGSGIWMRENYVTKTTTLSSPFVRATAPALVEAPAPHGHRGRPLPRPKRPSGQNKTVTIQSPATSQSWSTFTHPLLSPGVSDVATASPGEAIVTLPPTSPREVPSSRASPPAILVRQLTPAPAAVPNCPAPQRNHSTTSGFLMPPHEASTAQASPAVFVTPQQSPSAMHSSFCSSVYLTPLDVDVTARQPAASAGESVRTSFLSSPSDHSSPDGTPPACVEPPGLVPTPAMAEPRVWPAVFKTQ
ncbi:uncharacterized protein [Panulirus ornatus]|uniref:uncharacterized protein isoform X4 n=1 Tax=Panulirus ornatus TaxID=150431 RepID=UPI003A873851